MANRLVTKCMSDVSDLACVLANMSLNPLNRIVEFKDTVTTTIKGSYKIGFELNSKWWLLDTDTDVSTASDMDTGSISNGKDYFVYACDNSGTLIFKISLASTYPSGFTADTSRKMGGFHTLCTNAGTISGHTLTGYTANSILPQSIWDLKHRPICEPTGMVWSDEAQIWVDIYLASGTGGSTASVNNGTISDTRDWMDFVDDFGAVKKQLLDDSEFQLIAAGSNEETNITGSADPVTTGGHSDTASRRMISNIGCEDCAGTMRQWLRDQSAMYDAAVAAAWYDLPGSKGSLYRPVDTNDIKLGAGGDWGSAAGCGSRCRYTSGSRWGASTSIGGRGRSHGIQYGKWQFTKT